MSSTAPSAPASAHRAPRLHALLILLPTLLALLALTTPSAPSTPTPPATLSAEAAPETQQDATVTALRLPAPAPRLRDTPALVQAEARTHATPPPPRRLRPHVPTPRSVVLRC
ncbi:hypothetical protein [Streptomyces formicae]